MEMTVDVAGREPKPRVINVKQYSSGVDKVVFNFDELPLQNAACSIINNDYKQTLNLQNDKAEWLIPLAFTQSTGCFDIQLELSKENQVWKSDNMVLIVSESTEGSKPISTGNGIMSNIRICATSIVDDGVCGTYTEVV